MNDENVRLRLDIAYDGTAFAGWAAQRGQRTVQGELETALAIILRTPVHLTVAGRTDAGVHATGQVAHVDIPRPLWHDFEPTMVRRANAVLATDCRVTAVRQAPHDFDARFAALRRHYEYRIVDDPAGCDPLRRHDTVWWPRPLDAAAMDEAARLLLGEHDFAAFCRRREGATTIRALQKFGWGRDGNLLVAEVSADAFCHSMVRSLVGACAAVGEGRKEPDWPATLLARTERSGSVTVAPAHGLTLVGVDYPPVSELAARTLLTRNVRSRAAGEGVQG